MSGGITEERSNSFEDYYKTENFDDSELQARLYAEIYYESNVEDELRTTDFPRTIKFDSMTETNVESERTSKEQSSASKIVEDSQKMHSTDQTEFAQVDTLANREMNPTHGCDNESSKDPSVMQEKQNKENSSKKSKSPKHAKNANQESSEKNDNDTVYSKYNVVSKCVKQKRLSIKQIDKDKDSSDSEESIFEVPVPPKPKPPLIDLQDSDEESGSNSGIDFKKMELILNKWKDGASVKTYRKMIPLSNCELEFLQTVGNNHRDTSSKSKNITRSYKDIVNPDKNIQTCAQTEDIVLNCTTIQRGAKSISEIKQMSKSIGVNQESKSTDDTNKNSKKTSPQNKSKGNNENANLQRQTFVMSGKNLTQQNVVKDNVYNLRRMGQNKTSGIESCNPVIDRKRRCNEVESQSKQKRQCTIQQNNQDVTPQSNSNGEKRNVSSDFFKPMSEEMRNYYNSSGDQENFDVNELQQGMSKDPRMWTILDEDIMPCPSSRQRIRFWNVKCTNCHQEGHRRYDCPTLRTALCCYMCGMKGHTESRCPQKICLTCGHEQEQCPDLWRRYHQTTDMSSAPQDPGNVMKPSRLLYCCNCAKRGHESSTCREYRWSEHFPTPAVVTNYTDGPTYTSSSPHTSSFYGPAETDFLLFEARENEISIPQSVDIQPTMTENVESSANADTLSSNINFSISPTSQEAECISQMEGNLKSSLIWPSEKKSLRQTKVNCVTFSSIIHSYGFFRNKNHKDARMILTNLTTHFTRKRSTLNSLINHEIAPVFLKKLLEKEIKFEVKIGFTQRRTLSLQLLAMKEYIEYLYDLLTYWFNLPDDEKDYGIDVTLPVNSIKMFNSLQTRMPQLKKMRFTRYAEHIGGTNDPRWIYTCIKNEKDNLKQYKRNIKMQNRLRKKLLRLQIKLLMIVNTEPKPNVFINTYLDVMKRFKSKLDQMGEKLDVATYLRLTLLYNHLFVPHTSKNIYETLHRVEIEENKNNDLLSIQEVPETRNVSEQENFVYNVYSSSAASCPSQNIDFENSSAINNQQNNETLEAQNVNDTSLEMSKMTDRNYDEITVTIKNSLIQDPQIIPVNTKPVNPSVQLEDPERNEGQLPTSEVNIESDVSANKQDTNVNDTPHLTKKERKKKLKEEKKKLKEFSTHPNNISNTALNFIKKARAFKLPHMMNAANEIQKQISNQTIKPKHVRTLVKLIQLEETYQKNINIYCKLLKQQ